MAKVYFIYLREWAVLGEVSIRGLKQWASGSLPWGSSLRAVLLDEPDTLGVDEFLAKIPIWLKLASIEAVER